MPSLYAAYHSLPHPHLIGGPAGGHQRADPTEQDRQNQERAIGDCSAHGAGSKAPEDEALAAQEGEASGEAEVEVEMEGPAQAAEGEVETGE